MKHLLITLFCLIVPAQAQETSYCIDPPPTEVYGPFCGLDQVTDLYCVTQKQQEFADSNQEIYDAACDRQREIESMMIYQITTSQQQEELCVLSCVSDQECIDSCRSYHAKKRQNAREARDRRMGELDVQTADAIAASQSEFWDSISECCTDPDEFAMQPLSLFAVPTGAPIDLPSIPDYCNEDPPLEIPGPFCGPNQITDLQCISNARHQYRERNKQIYRDACDLVTPKWEAYFVALFDTMAARTACINSCHGDSACIAACQSFFDKQRQDLQESHYAEMAEIKADVEDDLDDSLAQFWEDISHCCIDIEEN